MASRIKRPVPVTVNDVLDGHMMPDLECLDQLYLHGYLGQLQVGGQVIQFLTVVRSSARTEHEVHFLLDLPQDGI
jgi:hypothetical protein